MKKIYKIILILVAVLAVLALLLIWGRYESNKPGAEAGPILFYGEGCPHCALVDKYIADNGLKNKLAFTELEVFNNQANADLMAAKARGCGLDTSQNLGVPFFFTGDKCLEGDQEIIDYFKSTIK